MRILFVSSGNSKNGLSPIVGNQADSLIKLGCDIQNFTIQGKGFSGYFRNIFLLRAYLSKNKFDVIHAHYSLSAIVTSLAGGKSIVVSLMGSDVRTAIGFRLIIQFFARFFWRSVIVKSYEMKKICGIKKAEVIPNGVDFSRFREIRKNDALAVTMWDPGFKHVFFAADPERKEKNFDLAHQAFESLKRPFVKLHTAVGISNELMPYYYNSSDVVILSSVYEGSPNVIKEAMACNRPIVTTDVGDVRDVLGRTKGCYVTTFNPDDYAYKLNLALDFGSSTFGREHIENLDEAIIASKLINIYKEK